MVGDSMSPGEEREEVHWVFTEVGKAFKIVTELCTKEMGVQG
jgi:hypothetical protein